MTAMFEPFYIDTPHSSKPIPVYPSLDRALLPEWAKEKLRAIVALTPDVRHVHWHYAFQIDAWEVRLYGVGNMFGKRIVLNRD